MYLCCDINHLGDSGMRRQRIPIAAIEHDRTIYNRGEQLFFDREPSLKIIYKEAIKSEISEKNSIIVKNKK